MPRSQLYALVKWIGQKENNTYTPDVPVEWIKDFDADHFDPENVDRDESYVIEWHDKKKKPQRGWDCYDGIVVCVSSRRSKLEKKMRELSGQLSPERIVRGERSRSREIPGEKRQRTRGHSATNERSPNRHDDLRRSHEKSPQKSGGLMPAHKESMKSMTLGISRENNIEEEDQRTPNGSITPFLKTATTNKINERTRPAITLEDLMLVIRKGHEDINANEKKRSNQINGILQRLDALENRTGSTSGTNKGQNSNVAECQYARPVSCNEIEIGTPGSKVIISQDQWYIAKSKSSFTAAGLSLLTAVFPLRELLKCNLRGGASKISKSTERHTALNQNWVQAIKYTVRKMFEIDYCEKIMNIAINNKLCSLRRKNGNCSSIGDCESGDRGSSGNKLGRS